MAKKYASLDTLRTFLDNLSNKFATLTHSHTISDISDFTVDSSLSPTSNNPVQNRVLDAEFEAISEALNVYDAALDGKASVTHTHEIVDVNNLQSTIDTININVDKKSQVQIVTTESTETLPTLKIHRLTQEEYDQELENGTLEENALYLTPDEEIDLSGYATVKDLETKASVEHNHNDFYYTKSEIDENIATINNTISESIAETKSYADTNNSTTLETAKTYTDNAVAQKSQVQIITWGVDD